ncbi:putative colanic acid biosysnthesis UDP-glucose lipid carrier transferase [Paenimyroides aquimaris]|uniref:Putative colanic acid biosysnthesis UDP-glucose lipid carrier transferase n=1 Tax=Paenimyroides marinum TaxID=1159016 RepID=A0A1H6LAY9_9FLAO|nr:exopolysaccharide biosynthesis polyprenyl glycosylphosphotransferase [Paenimyroides aquimaris]SEH83272.1 putative colanic acid biosysnthesis UDP-glucose lipid carrier transferase [Paenimyroides aquimaris]
MKRQIGRYSKYLRPITITFDLLVLVLLGIWLLPLSFQLLYFYLYLAFSWIVISVITKFYQVYRFTKLIQIAQKAIKQYFLFSLNLFALNGLFSLTHAYWSVTNYLLFTALVIIPVKYLVFYLLKIFRKYYRGNLRKIVVVGHDDLTDNFLKFVTTNADYGYLLCKSFSLLNTPPAEIISYCKEKDIDEIYLSLEKTTTQQVSFFINYVDNNLKLLKFLPSKKDLLSANLKVDYYGVIPVMPSRTTPLNDPVNYFIKRVFDIFFSLFVVVFVMSWLIPLVALLIRIESKGPIFFKQKRHGLDYEEFNCYKFRSMFVNEKADIDEAVKNDPRITKIGAFLRRTSIDEMPQFFNVLIGNMSVVGPRPHMLNFTEKYAVKVNKFKARHFIKPGITGMAQTHGYRGEIENDTDIINRIKYDIFYMESWSLLLDVKIIYLTIKNAIKGEKKAY